MPCPFLKQGRARYCHAAPIRKLILTGAGAAPSRCASPGYRLCDLVRAPDPAAERCPHLEEIAVQYCAASPVTQLVPFNDSHLSRCNGESYRYCDSYLAAGQPRPSPAPPDAMYAPNHFWLQAEPSHLCHIGIDAFLAEVAGAIDGITFVTAHGLRRPIVALSIRGLEWPMVFPNTLLIENVNSGLHRNPERITADPYGTGWLFEGWEVTSKTRAGLLAGPQAAAWQASERERLAYAVSESEELACDGGHAQPGVARLLPRHATIALFQRFFSRRDWTVEDF
jgi:glycine cleavage system H lipoate-binding protein